MKKLIIIAFAFILIGAFLLGAGIASGGDLLYTSITSRSASWWPFRNVSVNLGWSGIIRNSKDDDEAFGNYTHTFSDVSKLEVQASLGNVTIRPGNENKVIFENIYESDRNVEEKNNSLLVRVDGYIADNASVVIEVKENMLQELIVDSDVGNVDIQNISVDKFDVSTNIANIDIQNMMSEQVDISSDAGKVSIQGAEFNDATFSVDVGMIFFDGILRGNNEISCDAGSIDMRIKGNKDDYHYEIDNDLGHVNFGGDSYNGFMETNVNIGSKYYLELDCNIGSLTVEFYD